MKEEIPLHGILAEFTDPGKLRSAAREAYARGYRNMDAYSPFPVDGLSEALGLRNTVVPLIFLAGGIAGGIGAYFMMWYANVLSYPINIGGRPLNSWVAFIPITFELTVLTSAIFGLVGLLLLNGLPRPHHPLFQIPSFERATLDRFFLSIESADPKFDRAQTRQFLESLQPEALFEIPR